MNPIYAIEIACNALAALFATMIAVHKSGLERWLFGSFAAITVIEIAIRIATK